MSYDAILTALADPTRRAVLDILRRGALPVGRIADGLPVSRPAVSQHLRVLLDAGLVAVTPKGTRNLYALAPGGAGPLVDWLGALRSDGAPSADGGDTRGVSTRLAPREAWRLFCDDLAAWWPVAQVSLSAGRGALPRAVTLDARDGGALRETLWDGSEGVWADVTGARPDEVLAFDWHLGLAAPARVRVSVEPAPDGSRLTVAHGGAGAGMWDMVLDRYAAAAASSLSNY